MGPSGDWKYWTIKDEKIYFFLNSVPKVLFLNEVEQNINAGDMRWNAWFPDITEAKISTKCAITTEPDTYAYEVVPNI